MKSLPSRERGLKSAVANSQAGLVMSLPSRERGLKYFEVHGEALQSASLPSRERGLKCRPQARNAPSI